MSHTASDGEPPQETSAKQWKFWQKAAKNNTSSTRTAAAQHNKKPKPELTVDSCRCCGTVLSYPAISTKFRCSVCQTTIVLIETPKELSENAQFLSHDVLKLRIDDCMKNAKESSSPPSDPTSSPPHPHSIHTIFKPLESYLYNSFNSFEILNNSFKLKKNSKNTHFSSSNVNSDEIKSFFNLLTKLPSKRPLYKALEGANDLLRRPKNLSSPSRLYWLLILLEIPFLSNCLLTSNRNMKLMINSSEIRGLSYEILKRVVGLLAFTDVENNHYLSSWFSKLSHDEFIVKVELINLYITFHLSRFFTAANKQSVHLHQQRLHQTGSFQRRENETNLTRNNSTSEVEISTAQEYEDLYSKDDLDVPSSSNQLFPLPLSQVMAPGRKKSTRSNEIKIKLNQYTNDWHTRSASIFLSMFISANSIRPQHLKVAMSTFYNSLVDFVNIRYDFDQWQSKKKKEHKNTDPMDMSGSSPNHELQSVLEYLHGASSPGGGASTKGIFYFCQYPFLISLGGKITILEYEVKRQMERKAEEAFIMSLDKKVAMDVHFKVKVRREYIVQDSLRSIQMNSNNLKKSLRVEFLGEAGIDAGGLKKEWFLLLTKSLFNPQNGMFSSNEESNLLWFNIAPIENFEMYYLFGVVLGLAIYNSTILDLKFPRALYKVLLDKKVTFDDYEQLYPTVGRQLHGLLMDKENDIEDYGLSFEASYRDVFGKTCVRELIEHGSEVSVTRENCEAYVASYIKFFMTDGVSRQLGAFKRGFTNVVGGNALSLFSAEEIELLICGSEETKIDTFVLRSVTKYVGWSSPDVAKKSEIVKWFWEYFDNLTFSQQKKVLLFITGSDRVPATGIQTMNFKVSRIGEDSNRLPLAHTCFNEVALYEYSSKEKFYKKIDFAVNESSGFGIR